MLKKQNNPLLRPLRFDSRVQTVYFLRSQTFREPDRMPNSDIVPTLVADLGGTNVRFALAHAGARPLVDASIRHYAVADFPSLTAAALHYLVQMNAQPRQAVFAVAGKVGSDEIRITNLPWVISIERTRSDLSLSSLDVINDFAGMSMAIPLLTAQDVETIGDLSLPSDGNATSRTIGIIGPGTGLGVGAYLLRDGKHYALQTEGGHVAFAPSTDEEIEILRYLSKRYGRVSNERLVCGSGLVNLYQASCAIAAVAAEDFTPAQITQHMHDRSNAQCVRAVEIFCAILGTIAGDLVLTLGAWDGIYLAGGMVPPMLPWLRSGEFRRRFHDKGRFAGAMQRVPTLAVTYAYAGLLGAAATALTNSGNALG
jgi:glucokinase